MEFNIHTLGTAPKESIQSLKKSKEGAGFIPNMHGVMAESSVLLNAYKKIGQVFSKSFFSSVEKEIIEMTTNQVRGCTYCIAAHSYFNRLDKFPEDILTAF